MACCTCCSKKAEQSGRSQSIVSSQNRLPILGDRSATVLKELNYETYADFLPDAVPTTKYTVTDFFYIGSILGAGEYSIVFQAVFLPTKEKVAIKYINDFIPNRKGIMRELQVLKISDMCPQLIKYHSHFRIKGKCYIVTEQLSALDFCKVLNPNLNLPPVLVRIYIKQLSQALMFLHERKIIHRDVTMKNLCLDFRGNLRLIDYNLSRIVNDPMGMNFSDLGSCQYAAPEIYMDKMCSYPVDWWSVGVCLYRFVTGGFPYPLNSRSVYSYYVIKSHKVVYPQVFFEDSTLLSLNEKLLNTNQAKRLGSKYDTEIMNEPYFNNENWDASDDVQSAILRSSTSDLVIHREACKNILSVLTEMLANQCTSKDAVFRQF